MGLLDWKIRKLKDWKDWKTGAVSWRLIASTLSIPCRRAHQVSHLLLPAREKDWQRCSLTCWWKSSRDAMYGVYHGGCSDASEMKGVPGILEDGKIGRLKDWKIRKLEDWPETTKRKSSTWQRDDRKIVLELSTKRAHRKIPKGDLKNRLKK